MLYSILSPGIEKVVFLGKLFPLHSGHQVQLITPDARVKYFELGKNPAELERKVMEAAQRLKASLPFRDNPWSHFKFSISSDKRINVDFAYVPEDDDWVGVYMRRVSDLTLEEADAAYIPEKDWREFSRRRLATDNEPIS